MGCRSDFLFAQPSALFGLARLFDLGGTFDNYNESPTPAMADAWALFNDWCQVGQDLSVAFPGALADTLRADAHEHGKELEEFLGTEPGKKLLEQLETIPVR